MNGTEPNRPRPARPRPDAGSATRSVRRMRIEHAQRLLPPRLVLLALVGCLLFGYPFLSVFSVARRVAGIPILYVYIFGAWLGFILVIGRLVDWGARRR